MNWYCGHFGVTLKILVIRCGGILQIYFKLLKSGDQFLHIELLLSSFLE